VGKIGERSTKVISKKKVEGRKYERNHSSLNINGVANPCQLYRTDMHENDSDVVASGCMLQKLLIDVLPTHYMLTL